MNPTSCARVVAAFLLASTAAAQSLPRVVDCGDLNGFPAGEPGYELLTEAGGLPGVTLDPPARDTVHVNGAPDPWFGTVWPVDVMTIDVDQLHQRHRFTSLQLGSPTRLSIDGLQPDTPYRVKLELGALYPWVELEDFQWVAKESTSRQIAVDVEAPFTSSKPPQWVPAVSGLRCTTSYASATMTTEVGGIVTAWVKAFADDTGTLNLRLRSDAGPDAFVYLTAFEVHAHEPLPVVYRRTGAGPLEVQDAALAPFVSLFNAGDLDGAEAWALAHSNAWRRGVALLHLAGWLDGSRDGRWHLLPQARTSLETAAASHPGAAWLLDEVASAERALAHFAARGYESAMDCPDEGGTGFMNVDCAEHLSWSPLGQAVSNVNAWVTMRELSGIVAPREGDTVLDDLALWNAGAIPADAWEPSPLVFAALKQWGLVVPSVNPQLAVNTNDPGAVEALEHFRDVFGDFVDLGFQAVDFPEEVELVLFDAYAASGEHPKDWNITEVDALFDDAQIASSWWGDLVAPEAASGGPEWADRQRELMRLHRTASDYWLDERLVDGAFGGGLGDDVELMLQLFPTLAGRRDQGDRRTIDRLDTVIRHVLDDSGLVAGGYYAGPVTDTQHAAEFTTNPFLVHRSLFGTTPTSFDVALGATANLRDTEDPASAFMQPTNVGRVHFRSWAFAADGVSDNPDQAVDALINGRAVVPGVLSSARDSVAPTHPMVLDLLDWARALRDDALDVSSLANGKPLGFVAPVSFPSNEMGKNGHWYSVKGNANDTSLYQTGVSSYAHGVLALAYERSLEPDRWRYLLPAVRMLRAVAAWEDAGGPGGPAGSANWAAARYHDDPRFGPTVVRMLELFVGEPVLLQTSDPTSPSTTYVDDALLARMRQWTEVEFVNQGLAVRYALADVSPCGVGFTAKSPNGLLTPYDRAITLHRHIWPLLTTRAYHTDRVFLNAYDGPNLVLGGHTGDILREGLRFSPRVRWTSRMDVPLELAISCNLRDDLGQEYSAFVHNAADAATDVVLELTDGLVPGVYRVDVGVGDPKCDLYQPGVEVSSTVVDKPGAGARVDLSIPPGLHLVRVVRLGDAAPPPAFDVAVDLPQTRALLSPGAASLEFTARVANVSSASSPALLLEWSGAVLDREGMPIEIDGLPLELPIGTQPIPALAGTSGYAMDEHVAELVVPVDPAIATVLLSGLGIQLRARLRTESVGGDYDPLNDARSKAVFADGIEVVSAP